MKRTPVVPAVQTALAIIDAIARDQANGSIQKVASSLKIAPATCYRILCTLEAAGWIYSTSAGQRRISAALVAQLLPQSDWRWLLDAAREPLELLAAGTELAAKLSVREGTDAVTVLRADSPRPMSVAGRLGARFSLVYGSSGAVLCGGLDEPTLSQVIAEAPADAWKRQSEQDFRRRVALAAKEGLCRDTGSFHAQVHTLSMPILQHGKVLAAVTLLGLPGDINDQNTKGLTKELRRCVQSISAAEKQR